MNPEQLLKEVANLILATAKTATGRIYVVQQEDEIKVLSSSERTSPAKVIASYKAEEARIGLTVKEWLILSRRLAATIRSVEK